MTEEHYSQLIELLNEKIGFLERDKERQRKEIGRLTRENAALRKKCSASDTVSETSAL